ncbi:MAG: hypothetical protein ACRCVJ_13030 [Clostridium sp.]|uniref:hypothetical protein n=1 Tax=Clostridium sp. TaxID=1506 RepID=UPI003F2DDDA7
MLKVNKNITLNGTSEVNGVQVVYMSASISTDGNNANINKNITNQEVYNANKSEVRKDMAEFEDAVYLVEDELNKPSVEGAIF